MGFGPMKQMNFKQNALSGISSFFLPPHVSDQLEMLNLRIFATLKRKMTAIHLPSTLTGQSHQMHRLAQGFYASMTPSNLCQSFNCAGVTVDIEDRVLRLKVDIS